MKIGKILVIATFAVAAAVATASAQAAGARCGRVAQYDGIDNAGLGLHDNAAADAGLAEAGGRRAVLAELAESGLDTKKICYDVARQRQFRAEQVKGK